MNPDQFIPGKAYLLIGKDTYHPAGFGQVSKPVDYSRRDVFKERREYGDGRVGYIFENFILIHETNPNNGKFRIGGSVTIDKILEA